MSNQIEQIRERIKARMDNTDAAGDYDEYADGQVVGLAAALRIIDEVEKEHPIPAEDTIKGWVARDENGQVWLYAQRPFRNHTVWTTDKGRYFIRIYDTLFPSLRWEDEPIEVEIIIKSK